MLSDRVTIAIFSRPNKHKIVGKRSIFCVVPLATQTFTVMKPVLVRHFDDAHGRIGSALIT